MSLSLDDPPRSPSPRPPRSGGAIPMTWRVAAAAVVSFLLVAGLAGVWFVHKVDPPGGPGATVTVDIPQGATTKDIGRLLAAQHVISSASVFDIYLKLNSGGPWQAGRYQLREHESMGDVVAALDRGPAVTYDRLTIPEGFTLEQIAARVGRLPGRSADKFLQLARSGTIRSRYEPAGSTNLEGLLFPDTYIIGEKDDEARILQRMVGGFEDQATAAGLDQAAAALRITPYQAVIVASMVEREARVADDRGKVAQVIYNRLAKGMHLGIDATIRYGLDKPSGPLLQSELARDTPYNTRTRAGLPPTPIANPGRAALDAALHPTPGPWLYYVIADADGHHAFVVTPGDFQKAVAEARRKGLL